MNKITWEKPIVYSILSTTETQKGAAQCETLGDPVSGPGDLACS
jgi:hypothetical protein